MCRRDGYMQGILCDLRWNQTTPHNAKSNLLGSLINFETGDSGNCIKTAQGSLGITCAALAND